MYKNKYNYLKRKQMYSLKLKSFQREDPGSRPLYLLKLIEKQQNLPMNYVFILSKYMNADM